MPSPQSPAAVLNGWLPFSPANRPQAPGCLFHGINMATRTLRVLHFAVSREGPASLAGKGFAWSFADNEFGTRTLVRSEDNIDFILPLSASCPPMPDQEVFSNPLPVVVMLVPTDRGLLGIRRAFLETYGKVALPGGFQTVGESWQQAGAREVREETGVDIDPASILLYDTVTVPDGSINLVFGYYDGVVGNPQFSHDAEILEVLEFDAPAETAFPIHTAVMKRFMDAHFEDGQWSL
jgi:ADP-ribose pyrophosphatase YjhB (NUDIX family)